MSKPAWLRKKQQKEDEWRRREEEKRRRINAEKRGKAIVTEGEKRLSKALEKKGIKHYKQVNVGPYVTDIVITKNGRTYVIEVEGRSHDSRQEYDKKRREEIEKRGAEVIRVSERDAREAPFQTADTIITTINYLERKKEEEEKAKKLKRFR